MRINRAIGLGIMLVVIQTLAAGVWYSVESTIGAFASFTQASLGSVSGGYHIPTVSTGL